MGKSTQHDKMSEEFAPYPDISNLFAQRMAEKIAIKNAEGGSAPPPPGTVDPYQLMIKKKQEETAVESLYHFLRNQDRFNVRRTQYGAGKGGWKKRMPHGNSGDRGLYLNAKAC